MLIFSFQYFSLQGGLGYTKKIDPFKTPVCIDRYISRPSHTHFNYMHDQTFLFIVRTKLFFLKNK